MSKEKFERPKIQTHTQWHTSLLCLCMCKWQRQSCSQHRNKALPFICAEFNQEIKQYTNILLAGHKTPQCTQSDGANPSCPPCCLSAYLTALVLRRIYDNRRKANNSQTDGMCTSALDCVLVCELWRSCVGQRGCNLISYITRVPAI